MNKDWPKTNEPFLRIKHSDYKVSKNAFFFLKINKINQIAGPYYFSPKKGDFEYRVVVTHKPTRVNLFHFELIVKGSHKIENGDWAVIKNWNDSGYKHLVAHAIRDKIVEDRMYLLASEVIKGE